MPEVLSAVNSGDESRVVIGANAYSNIMPKLPKLSHREAGDGTKPSADHEKNILKRVLNAIVSIMAQLSLS